MEVIVSEWVSEEEERQSRDVRIEKHKVQER